jgi:hypothetical protein
LRIAEHREVAERHLAQRLARQTALGLAVEADGEVAALAGDARPDRLGLRTSDEIENHLCAVAVSELHHPIADVFAGVVDRRGCAEASAVGALLRATRDGDHVRAGRGAQLDSRSANTAGSTDDEDGLTGLQLGPLVQTHVAGVEGEEERGGFDIVELGGRIEHAGSGADRVLGHAPERHLRHRDDAFAAPVLEAVSCGLDHATHVHAEGERWRDLHRRHAAASARGVSEVDRCGRHGDTDLARPDLGHIDVAHLDDLGRTSQLNHLNRLQRPPPGVDHRSQRCVGTGLRTRAPT